MEKTDIAYIAGLFDGEGCIRINKTSPKYYSLNVSVKMSWQWMPEFLRYCFGGSLYKCKLGKYYPNAKDQWSWVIRGQAAVEFLKTIMPYLKLKKAEAELALCFQDKKLSKADYLGVTHKGKRIRTDEELAVEEAQFILMKGLKK